MMTFASIRKCSQLNCSFIGTAVCTVFLEKAHLVVDNDLLLPVQFSPTDLSQEDQSCTDIYHFPALAFLPAKAGQ